MRNRKTSLKFVSKKKRSWWIYLDCCLFFFIFLQLNIFDIWLFTLVTQPGVVNSSRPTHTHPSHLSWFRPGPLCSANMTSQYMDGSQWTFWAVISWSVHWHACFMMMTGPLYTTGPSHVAAPHRPRLGVTGPRGSSCHIRSCATKLTFLLQFQYYYDFILAYSSSSLIDSSSIILNW